MQTYTKFERHSSLYLLHLQYSVKVCLLSRRWATNTVLLLCLKMVFHLGCWWGSINLYVIHIKYIYIIACNIILGRESSCHYPLNTFWPLQRVRKIKLLYNKIKYTRVSLCNINVSFIGRMDLYKLYADSPVINLSPYR